MCKLRKELQRISIDIQDDLHAILENPKIKAERRTKDLMVEAWHQNLNIARVDTEYDKCIIYGFNNIFTHKQASRLTVDELLTQMLAFLKIMYNAKEGDFNEDLR